MICHDDATKNQFRLTQFEGPWEFLEVGGPRVTLNKFIENIDHTNFD